MTFYQRRKNNILEEQLFNVNILRRKKTLEIICTDSNVKTSNQDF